MEQADVDEELTLNNTCRICHVCNSLKKNEMEHQLNIPESRESARARDQTAKEKLKASLSNPFSSKLHNFKQMFESAKNSSFGPESFEKKGLLQRMHSLSLLKSKEKIEDPVTQIIQVCQCVEGADNRFHTWPERGRDKLKSPKKSSQEIHNTETDDCVPDDVFLEPLSVAFDPLVKQLRVIPSKFELAKEVEKSCKKEMGHRRQPSLLSNGSSNGSQVHLPLMPLHSNPHSHTSLSSLSNYSSSTDFTEHSNSLERSCEPPRFGLASFWQRAFTRKSDTDNATASWNLFGRTNFFQKSSRSGQSSRSSLNSSSSPTLHPRNIGSTGLILHSRPSFLPAKCPEEELHHQLLHHKLLEESQRRDRTKLMVS